MNHWTHHSRGRRRAVSLLDVTVCAGMIAVLLAVTGQVTVAIRRQARALQHHALAIRAVESALESIVAKPWDEVNDDAIDSLPLPAEVQLRWPAAKLEGDVVESADPVPGKRITIELILPKEVQARPVKLSAWVFRAPAE
jgi:hypothetical protein